MAPAIPARRRDAAATRDAILSSAHDRFLKDSYESVGLRDIAGDAGVDVALVSRYFGGKEGLFREVLTHEKRPDTFSEPTSLEQLPGFLAHLIEEDQDDDRARRMEMFIIMLRSASSPKAGEIIRELIHRDVLDPMAKLIGGPEGEMRANMLLAVLMGISVLRTVMQVEGMCEAEPCQFRTERFRCLFEAAINC
jgi:AcrR family transcriptional regulator